MTVKNEQFQDFIRHINTKLMKFFSELSIKYGTFMAKVRRFRAKGHKLKVVGNAILKTFYFIIFFSRSHPLATNDC